jgi:hypothetical protein
MPFPFHPSDIAFFGRTEDLLTLFDIPLMTEAEAYWDKKNARFNRYVPEQHIFINCLRKKGKVVQCDAITTIQNITSSSPRNTLRRTSSF